MSFPRYPVYKDSGVEWWGDMPATWGIFPAKRSFLRKKELNLGMKCDNRLSLTLGGVVPRSLNDLDGLQAAEFETYQLFATDDLVFKLIDLQNIKTSRVGLVPEDGIMSPAYIRIAPDRDKVFPEFAYWFFTNLYNRCIFNELGGGVRQTISSEELLLLPFPALSVAEQAKIAAFLDRETAKIDALVAEQRRLMALLKEKRQAVISHAVTRGLNPDAPMKPSGIEWLGDVPEHWDVKPLRMIANVVRGASPRPAGDTRYFGGDAMPWVTVGEITKDDSVYLTETEFFLTEEGATHSNLFKSGTLVYSNSGATLGVPKVLSIDACANDGVVAFLSLDNRVQSEFVYHCLASITDSIREKVKQGSGKPNLNTDIVKDLRFGFPPLQEQELIVCRITELVNEFDALTTEAQRAIDLLQERRTALISAAVTGQIDVRGAV